MKRHAFIWPPAALLSSVTQSLAMEDLSDWHLCLQVDVGCDSAENRGLCLRGGIQPRICAADVPHGPGLRHGPSAARSGTTACGCWPTSGRISTAIISTALIGDR